MHDSEVHLRRALPLRRQTAIAGVAAAVVLGALAIWLLSYSHAERVEAAQPAATLTTNGFRPTAQQMAGLKIEPVSLMNFRAETVTDGNIAIDDDLVTPVFSPFSGRVMRVIAKLGDNVLRGSPLLEVEASEFVQ